MGGTGESWLSCCCVKPPNEQLQYNVNASNECKICKTIGCNYQLPMLSLSNVEVGVLLRLVAVASPLERDSTQ